MGRPLDCETDRRVNAGRFSECLSVKLSMGVFNTGVEHAKRFATSPCVKGELFAGVSPHSDKV